MSAAEVCPHGFAYWENACLVCTTDPEDAPDVMTPERPRHKHEDAPRWGDYAAESVTWWHPGKGVLGLLPAGATTRSPGGAS